MIQVHIILPGIRAGYSGEKNAPLRSPSSMTLSCPGAVQFPSAVQRYKATHNEKYWWFPPTIVPPDGQEFSVSVLPAMIIHFAPKNHKCYSPVLSTALNVALNPGHKPTVKLTVGSERNVTTILFAVELRLDGMEVPQNLPSDTRVL